MFTRLVLAAAVALFLTPALALKAQEHPEHPKKVSKEHPEDAKRTKADISAGIKNNIASESKKASDGKFHVNYEGKDLALDLVKVHFDRIRFCSGRSFVGRRSRSTQHCQWLRRVRVYLSSQVTSDRRESAPLDAVGKNGRISKCARR